MVHSGRLIPTIELGDTHTPDQGEAVDIAREPVAVNPVIAVTVPLVSEFQDQLSASRL